MYSTHHLALFIPPEVSILEPSSSFLDNRKKIGQKEEKKFHPTTKQGGWRVQTIDHQVPFSNLPRKKNIQN